MQTGIQGYQSQKIEITATGATVLTVPAGKRAVIHFMQLLTEGATQVQFGYKIGNGGDVVELTGPMPIAAEGGFASGYSERGHFILPGRAQLVILLSDDQPCGGWLNYSLQNA